MDKVLRNIIIFASVIVLIAVAFVFMTLVKNPLTTSSQTSTTGVTGTVGSINSNTGSTTGTTGEVQNVKLSVSGANYILTPSVLKKDVPVRMEVDLTTVRGCAKDIVISAFGVRKAVKTGDNIITFTPDKTGTFGIACSMNMYVGKFTVE